MLEGSRRDLHTRRQPMTFGSEVQESKLKYCGWYEQFILRIFLVRVSADAYMNGA
jgi:hypothetical protein